MKLRGKFKISRLLRNQRGSVTTASFGQRIVEFIRSDSSGSALVELAIALPVYLIIITGMLSTVMALYSYQQLAFATFAASEAIGANRGLQSDPCKLAAIEIVNSLPVWNLSNFRMDIWITQDVNGVVSVPPIHYGSFTLDGTTATDGAGPATCSGDQATPGNGTYTYNQAANEPVTVRASYVYKWFPIYSNQITSGPLVAAETSIIR